MEDAPRPSRKFSIDGLVIILLTTIVGFALVLPATNWNETPYKSICQNNLKNIHVGMCVYYSAFGSNHDYPPHVGTKFLLCLAGLCDDKRQHPHAYFNKAPLAGIGNDFNCLLSKEEGVFASYLGPKKHTPNDNPSALAKDLPPDTPIAADKKGNHKDGGNVLFFDGSVKFLPDEEYEKALKELE
jgi:prepilin-type processing-associated H-X9-DG protein